MSRVKSRLLRLTAGLIVSASSVLFPSGAVAATCSTSQVQVTATWLFDTSGIPVINDGRGQIVGSVFNSCEVPADVEVDVVERMQTDSWPSPVPYTSARSVWVQVGSHQQAQFRTDVALGNNSFLVENVSFAPAWSVLPVSQASEQACMQVGATRCLSVDGHMWGAASLLFQTKSNEVGLQGVDLLRWAADSGVRITRGVTAPGVLGSFDSNSRVVTIDQRLDANSQWERAAVLAHELQHVVDFASGQNVTSPQNCYLSEERAFQTEARMWAAMWWPHGYPVGANSAEDEITRTSLAVRRDPEGFVRDIVPSYTNECAGVH
jgi:hypothetical protein